MRQEIRFDFRLLDGLVETKALLRLLEEFAELPELELAVVVGVDLSG